ncbi:DUF402 domain-containing protein [Halobacteria archaeon AArc-m2/3/4]|uniref:Probable ribonuclease FAU-1 n=1 Tax=Natronoglomus mannanivorans TaxID=2979990 RepID=A0ABT2QHH1_9EURY|nr:DUF402 domain-containing protein [Halobacteria archaeon AArc-m2/3/4]
MTTARVRGIYTTAITHLLEEHGVEVVQASEPIRERFDGEFAVDPADVTVETTRDRQGVGISGTHEGVDEVAAVLESLAIDTFRWDADTPRSAVFDATVDETLGGGAVVDLGDRGRGYLSYDDANGYVDDGDSYRVQVTDPTPPWDDDRPRVEPTLEIRSGLLVLSRSRSGVSVAASGERASELVGMTDLLPIDLPEGWGLRWQRAALEADLDAMGTALERAVERAEELEDELPAEETDTPTELAIPEATTWLWFGRESRTALDEARREVETTMPGHHRTKAATRAASAAVDFVEAVCDPSGEFPFGAVSGQFGPTSGDRLSIDHGKPDGRLLTLGTGDVTEWDPDGKVTLERRMRGGGSYDALGVSKEDGDVAVTKFREGRWWYPTTYRGSEGSTKGTYVNICTPVELFPDSARYVDLYVDVIRLPDGTVEVVDEDELEAAVADGLVSDELAEKARSVASAVERALSK